MSTSTTNAAVSAHKHAYSLTKSLFTKGVSCPRKLAYALSRADSKAPTAFEQHLANNGRTIGLYSRFLYPEGVEIGVRNNRNNRNMDVLVDETTDLLFRNENKDKKVTLFEAAIRSGPFLIRADILHKSMLIEGGPNNSQPPQPLLHLEEVKAKAWDSRKGDIHEQLLTKKGTVKAEYLPYLQDVAFQKLVTQWSFPQARVQASLVLPDKARVNTTVSDWNAKIKQVFSPQHVQSRSSMDELLVVSLDVDEIVDQILDQPLQYPGCPPEGVSFRETVVLWGEHVDSLNQIQEQEQQDSDILAAFSPPPIGAQCKTCEYAQKRTQCWQEVAGKDAIGDADPSSLVMNLYFGGKTVGKLIEKGTYMLNDVVSTDLGLTEEGQDPKKKPSMGISRKEKQWYQASQAGIVLDRDYLHAAMDNCQYPYHFIDFETILPVLSSLGKAPYATVAFQFSHHTLEQNGRVVHASEFLHTHPGECPNVLFLKALSKSLGDTQGTVFRWGAHENTILSSLLQSERRNLDWEEYDMLESLLSDGERAMVDLMAIMSKGYYAPGSGASSSLKQLLLPTLQASTKLRDTYGIPTYSGKNFTNMQWWVESSASADTPRDPYSLLPGFETNSSSEGVTHGGDAIAIYECLQQLELDSPTRVAMEDALKRYCELDTLAMVMIAQGIQGLLEE